MVVVATKSGNFRVPTTQWRRVVEDVAALGNTVRRIPLSAQKKNGYGFFVWNGEGESAPF